MYNYDISKVFSFLPSEKIKACELKAGDIAFIHSQWQLLTNTFHSETFDNHGHNFVVNFLTGGISYLQPNYEVSLIKRDIVNTIEMDAFISNHLKKMEELRKLQEKEDQEKIERECEYHRRKLRDLGELV